MSEQFYSQDEYLRLEALPGGWTCDIRALCINEEYSIDITIISYKRDEDNTYHTVYFDPLIEVSSVKEGRIFIGGVDDALFENSHYEASVSYNLYKGTDEDRERVESGRVVSIRFETTDRSGGGDVITYPPIINKIWDNTFPRTTAVYVELDIASCQGKTYDLTAVVTDRNGETKTFIREAMSVTSEIGNTITYAFDISADDFAYGKIDVYLNTKVVNSSAILDANYQTFLLFKFYSPSLYKRKNNEFLTADEWNEFNELLAEEIPSYDFDGVLPGQAIDIAELNKPIIAYYNYKFEYFNGITPRFMMHFGNAPEGAVSAKDFFETLEAMLNSFYTEAT